MKNRQCLITGATRGLGEALTRAFWDAGANLILVARRAADLERLIHSLGERPGQEATPLAADLADPVAASRVVGLVQARYSQLDVLINNAAVQGPVGPLWANDWDEWLKALQIDLFSPIALCRSAAPWMMERGGGSMINVSGGGATKPRPNFTAYATAKAALVRFSETLAEELRLHNVRVNCIAPGALNTSMMGEIVGHGPQAAGQMEYSQAVKVQQDGGVSMGRAADLCLFLVSDAAASITGKLISAVWDPWRSLAEHLDDLNDSDIYTLRRISPEDRGKAWGSNH